MQKRKRSQRQIMELTLSSKRRRVFAMTIQLKPEQEQIIALREKSNTAQATVGPSRPRKKLYDLLTEPPFAGSELNLERQKDYPGPVDL